MSKGPDFHVERPGPTELTDPVVRTEMKKAGVWFGFAIAVALVALLSQPLLLIVGGIVLASILDGGTRLLGRVLPISRGWRLLLVTLLAFGSLAAILTFAGMQLVSQAATFQTVITDQVNRLLAWVNSFGLVPGGVHVDQIASQLMGSLGRLTHAVGSVLGSLTSMAMIVVIGLFVAAEPRLYERGIAWMLPMRGREEFYRTAHRVGFTLRRLMAGRMLGMAVEGVGTWLLLWAGGIPLAGLLGLITGLLAFLPNIGSIISGVLIVMVGFSAGWESGLWAFGVYAVVQILDGYVIVPYVARKTVDLAPALVLGAQLLFGALFGILGLALADPIIAMIKAALEQRSLANNGAESGAPEP